MNGHAPSGRLVRLDERLVADLPKGADFERVTATVNDMVCSFLTAAAVSFSVPSPGFLRARGLGEAALAQSKLLLFNRVLCLRAAELLPDAVRAINDSRLVTFALATRGLLETAAVASYHAQFLVVEEGATALPHDYHESLRAAVLGGRFDWLRLGSDPAARAALIEAYDTDPEGQQPANAATNIVTMVDKLGRKLALAIPKARGTIRFAYAVLSDMCHPAAGSNMIFITGSEPDLQAELVPQRVTLLGVAATLLPCLAVSAQALVDVLAELERVAERLEEMPQTAAAAPAKESAGALTPGPVSDPHSDKSSDK